MGGGVAGPGDAAPYAQLKAAGVPVHRLALGRGYSQLDSEASSPSRRFSGYCTEVISTSSTVTPRRLAC